MVGRLIFAALFCAMLGWSLPADAHGGGLDDLGCHNDRKQGVYHCHRGPMKGNEYDSKTHAQQDLVNADQAPAGDDRVKETRPVSKDEDAVSIAGVAKWIIRSERSRFDGSPTVYAALLAEDMVVDSYGMSYTPFVAVRCREGETSFLLTYGNLFISLFDKEVEYRLDDGRAHSDVWSISTNSYAVGLWASSARHFVDSLYGHDKLVFRMTPSSENQLTSTFDISGIREAAKPVRDTCGW